MTTPTAAGPYERGRPSRRTPPPRAGTYRIRTAAGELRYLGETANLARRLAQHRRTGRLPTDGIFEWKAAVEGSTWQQRRAVERRHIDRHRPPDNRRRGGGGRPPQDT